MSKLIAGLVVVSVLACSAAFAGGNENSGSVKPVFHCGDKPCKPHFKGNENSGSVKPMTQGNENSGSVKPLI